MSYGERTQQRVKTVSLERHTKDNRKLTERDHVRTNQRTFEIRKDDTPATTTAVVESRDGFRISDQRMAISRKLSNVELTGKQTIMPKEQVFCNLTDRSMELHIADLENKNYVLVINKLLEPINVEESHWKQKTDMVVIFLAKVHVKVKWSHVTEIEKKYEDQRNSRFKSEESDKKDPEESIMDMMRKMYESGDDDMKRMIAKAMYESQHKKKTDIVDFSKAL